MKARVVYINGVWLWHATMSCRNPVTVRHCPSKMIFENPVLMFELSMMLLLVDVDIVIVSQITMSHVESLCLSVSMNVCLSL